MCLLLTSVPGYCNRLCSLFSGPFCSCSDDDIYNFTMGPEHYAQTRGSAFRIRALLGGKVDVAPKATKSAVLARSARHRDSRQQSPSTRPRTPCPQTVPRTAIGRSRRRAVAPSTPTN